MSRHVIGWFAALTLGWLATPAPSPAAVSALSIFPSRHAISVAPGTATTVSVNVANNGDEPLRIRAYPADWTLGPTGEMAFLSVGQVPHSAHRMIRMSPSHFVLPPDRQQQVRIEIAVPAGMAGGEYHGMVFFETAPSRSPAKHRGATMLVNQRIGETLYVAVPPVRKEATIRGLAYLPPAGGQPARMGLAIENLGTMHVRGVAKLTLSRGDGRPVVALPIDDLILLRESRRLFYLPLAAPLPRGRYQASLSFDYGGEAVVEAETELEI